MKDDEVWMRDEIQSPCVKVCVIHPAERICTGCYRTLDEIARWSQMGHEARAEIMDGLKDRASRLKTRRGGRAARLARE